jgi:hypothetical protein
MAFQQLHYTSCQDGPAGYSGFQFSATTPGTSPVVLREVEELTVYQPPAWLLASPGLDEPDAYPVAFSHAASAATGAVITAQVVFAGTDYSGRPGNYFAHALVTATPEADFGPVLPAELWRADLWQREPGRVAELPELRGPPRAGPIDPAGVQAFLDAQGLASLLAELLTAVSQAMAGAPPVLLACRDATECAWWIAALCYLLGERLGRQLTFTTYSHRPATARFHLIGILSDVVPPDADLSFQSFNLTSGLTPGGEVHPLASLLADTGVLAAAALWRQALALASGAEKGLDDWLPVVTAAAGLLGRPLTPAERTDVAQWAGTTASHLPAGAADAVLGLLLAQPAEPLTAERLIRLLGLASQTGPAGRVAQIEDLLIEDAVSRIHAGQPVGPARLSERGKAAARDQAAGLLTGATPGTALAVLDWAGVWSLGLPETRLEQYGRGCRIGGPLTPELAQLLRRSPAVRRGLLIQLDGAAPELAETVLAGPTGIRREELAGFPILAELWLLQAAALGMVAPVRALDEIADIRAAAGRSPRIDQALLDRLWPDGCPPGQLVELLDLIIDELPDDVVRWLSTEAGALAAYWEPDDDWYRLAGVVASHPVQQVLAAADLQIMRTAAQAGPLLIRARASASQGDADVFAELFALYRAAADSRMRGVLDSGLAVSLAAAQPLGPALRDCPDEVALAFGTELASRLARPQADVALAARVFAAQADPDVAGQPTLASQLAWAVQPVRTWSRRDLAALNRALDSNDAAAKLFRTWSGRSRSARFWRRSR